MGRRPQAGRDLKIIQGQRRDAFFKKMRRKGGVPRLPTQGTTAVEDAPVEEALAEDTEPTTAQASTEAPENIATEEGATETR